MSIESRPGSLSQMPDDRLGTVAVSLVVSEVEWTPDVAPAVMDRISRDAVAYPEQFDRRPLPPATAPPPLPSGRSAKRTVSRLVVFGVILAVIVGFVVFAATANGATATAADLDRLKVDLVEVASGYDEPIFMTAAGDGSGDLYVVEQTGRIWQLRADGDPAAAPFLDLSADISKSFEQGLLGLAFHPDYGSNGRLYVDYTRAGDGATVVSEFRAADGLVERRSERELLVIEQPFANHNGGMVAFDSAGMLLVGMGDGGGGGDPLESGQDPNSLLGKLLRLDVDAGEPYAIPPDNGFLASDAHRPEIHAMGLRNPWRFSVDSVGGHVYVGDVGQGDWEEISVLPEGRGGQSFGWNEVEGPACFRAGCDPEAHTAPAVSYGRDAGCSVVGGYAYRGSAQPGLAGVYLFGDYCSGTIWGADADALVAGEAAALPIGAIDGTLVSFGVDDEGEIYAVDQRGRILHVVTEAS
jgi:glucose/arabinose dehydrogenase